MSLLKVTNVDAHYGRIQALKSVTLHVDAGEIVSLIGGNGAGKTTCLNVVSGLHPPTRGEIVFQNASLKSLAAAES